MRELQFGIILVTGHIGAGKSTLYKQLQKRFGSVLTKVDIRSVNARNDSSELFRGIEKRAFRFLSKVMQTIQSHKLPYVELLGYEGWFPPFLRKLLSLPYPLVQIELQTESLQDAEQNIINRWGSLCEGMEVELYTVRERWGTVYNNNARLFTAKHSETIDMSKVIEYVISELQLDESGDSASTFVLTDTL
jgi:shikimate kinase